MAYKIVYLDFSISITHFGEFTVKDRAFQNSTIILGFNSCALKLQLDLSWFNASLEKFNDRS